MALVKLELPPGVYSHGTDYQSSGRWHDSNLVRWEGKSIRPISGWQVRHTAATTEPPRGALVWLDNDHDPHIAMGDANALYTITSGGTITDITPTAGLAVGYPDATEIVGFGGKPFGTGFFGIQRPTDGVLGDATSWSLANFGEYLIACSSADQIIYEYILTGVAAPVANAPTATSIVVTAERFLFALGASGVPRKVQWCDRENNTDWTPAATNEAGDIELQTNGEIMSGLQVRGRTLLLTTTDAHIATYSGPPTVYGFERVGVACGVISRMSGVAVSEGAFWMGESGFFYFNGSSVEPINCEVHDRVFFDLNRQQRSKVIVTHNSQYNEVWWFYPSEASTENNRYVAYDYKENIWHIGAMSRTAACDVGVFTTPIWFGPDGNVYNHDLGYDYEGDTPFVESGPVNIGNGDNVMHVTQMIPDEQTQGDVTAIFKTRFYPNGVERSYGPFSMSNPTSLRMTGRQIRVRLTGTALTSWRIGTMRVDISQGGKR
jgi:hypothetical protein